MAADELKKFSDELRDSREAEEISLDEISSKTRIDIKFLKAIEEGNFSVMPEVYIRAFIKEYAAFINLNPDETLKKFDLAKKGKTAEPVIEEKPEKSQPEKKKKSEKRTFDDDAGKPAKEAKTTLQPKKVFIYGAAVVLIMVLIAVYFLFVKDSSPDIVVERPFDEVLEEKSADKESARFEAKESTESNTDAVKQPVISRDSLSLLITASDTCWVNVTIDETVEKEFMLFNNNSQRVKALNRFDLIIGNVGGVSLQLNGTPLELAGAEGQRRTLAINKDGIIGRN